MSISKNIEEVLKDIEKYSPYPERVTLVAVTKHSNIEQIEEVLESGILNLGENRVQVLTKKNEELIGNFEEKKWHFIGNLQKNKVKYIADFISTIHSINKLSLAQEVDKKAKEYERVIDVFIEINIFEEVTKEGYIYSEFINDIPELLKLKNINIIGLMTMAPYTENIEYIRTGFQKLKQLKEELNILYFNDTLTELSMGMSNDYKIALEEGATYIRIGTKLFD